jgi:hypothetical protein
LASLPRWKTDEKRVAKLADGRPANEAAAENGCRCRSSSVAELGRDEDAAESGSRSATQLTEKDEEVHSGVLWLATIPLLSYRLMASGK